jgi:hypothetical protein
LANCGLRFLRDMVFPSAAALPAGNSAAGVPMTPGLKNAASASQSFRRIYASAGLARERQEQAHSMCRPAAAGSHSISPRPSRRCGLAFSAVDGRCNLFHMQPQRTPPRNAAGRHTEYACSFVAGALRRAVRLRLREAAPPKDSRYPNSCVAAAGCSQAARAPGSRKHASHPSPGRGGRTETARDGFAAHSLPVVYVIRRCACSQRAFASARATSVYPVRRRA